MLVDASGNQQFKIVQGSNTTTVTIDVPNNRIQKQVNSGPVVNTAGTGTGVIYCNGSITALSGTIADNRTGGSPVAVTSRSAFTIATDPAQDITISGSVKYKTAYNPALGPDNAANLVPGTLGLVSRNITVKAGSPTSMEVDAVVLAGSSTGSGSFSVEDYDTRKPTGTLKVVGGIIQKERGPVGTLTGGGALNTGYAKDYLYDARMADNPPPYFPTTGGYDRISWRRLVSGS